MDKTKIKKKIEFILAVSVLVMCMLAVPAIASEEKGGVQPLSPDLVLTRTDYGVSIAVEDVNQYGRYTAATADGKDILFGYPNAWSSYTTIRINGTDYYQDSTMDSYLTQTPTVIGDSIVTKWNLPANIAVTEKLTLMLGNIEFRFTIKNNDATSHNIKVRYMFDTQLVNNDGAPFKVPGVGDITTEQEFINPVFDYWQAMDSLANPTLTSNCTFVSGNNPYKVQFARWPDIKSVPFDYTITEGQSITSDSAVGMYWDFGTLTPGETKNVVVYYSPELPVSPPTDSITIHSPADGSTPAIHKDDNGDSYISIDGTVTVKEDTSPGCLVKVYGPSDQFLGEWCVSQTLSAGETYAWSVQAYVDNAAVTLTGENTLRAYLLRGDPREVSTTVTVNLPSDYNEVVCGYAGDVPVCLSPEDIEVLKEMKAEAERQMQRDDITDEALSVLSDIATSIDLLLQLEGHPGAKLSKKALKILTVFQAARQTEETGGGFGDFFKRSLYLFSINIIPFTEDVLKYAWEGTNPLRTCIYGPMDTWEEVPPVGFMEAGVEATGEYLPANYYKNWQIGPYTDIFGLTNITGLMVKFDYVYMGPGDYFRVYEENTAPENQIWESIPGVRHDPADVPIHDEIGHIIVDCDNSGADSYGFKFDPECAIYLLCHHAEYYNYDDSGTHMVKLGTEPTEINFSWGAGSPYPEVTADNFAAVWSGQIYIPGNDTYTFYVASEHGTVDARINCTELFSNCIFDNPAEASNSTYLYEGWHNFVIGYHHTTGDASFVLSWENSTMSKQVVPDENMRTARTELASLPLTAFFSYEVPEFNNNVSFTDLSFGDNIVQWKWDYGDGTPVETYNRSVNPFHEYSATGVYNVSLTVTNSTGGTSTYSEIINMPIEFFDDFDAPDGPVDPTKWHGYYTYNGEWVPEWGQIKNHELVIGGGETGSQETAVRPVFSKEVFKPGAGYSDSEPVIFEAWMCLVSSIESDGHFKFGLFSPHDWSYEEPYELWDSSYYSIFFEGWYSKEDEKWTIMPGYTNYNLGYPSNSVYIYPPMEIYWYELCGNFKIVWNATHVDWYIWDYNWSTDLEFIPGHADDPAYIPDMACAFAVGGEVDPWMGAKSPFAGAMRVGYVRVQAPFPPCDRPDITVTGIEVPEMMRPNFYYPISATIKNQGTIDATEQFSVGLEIDGNPYDKVEAVGPLSAGESTSVSFTVSLSEGCHNFTVTADCDNNISESDETNNATLEYYQVGNVIAVRSNSDFDELLWDSGLPFGSVVKVGDTYYIQDLNITNCAGCSITIENTTVPFVITNCTVNDCGCISDLNFIESCNGILLRSLTNGKINDCTVKNNTGNGISIQNSTHVDITNNLVQDNWMYGIEIYPRVLLPEYRDDSKFINITNNMLKNNYYNIMLIGSNCTIGGNTITG